MKINKRGSQIPAINSGFHSRKNSLRENSNNNIINQQSMNPLAQTANIQGMINGDKMQVLSVPGSLHLLSESQPVLAKANEKPNIQINLGIQNVHKRNPSHQNSQQISLNDVNLRKINNSVQQVQSNLSGSSSSAAYMLKLQKYKKMKSELNNQTKNVIKKVKSSLELKKLQCLGSSNNPMSSNNDLTKINHQHKSSNQSIQPPPYSQSANITAMLTSQTTKNSQASQIIFNQHQMLVDSKENSNYNANSQYYLQGPSQHSLKSNHQKSQTIKFSINNILSELNNKVVSPGMKQLNHNDHNIKSVSMMQNVIAAKNHSTLMNQSSASTSQSNNTKQLASSKMMMALHKKCNSIATPNISSTTVSSYQQHQPTVNNTTTTHREASQKQKSSNTIINQTCLVLDQENISNNYSSNQPTKNQKPQSQVEFFDENVRVNQVPQITPRHQDKRKTINERYKQTDYQKQIILQHQHLQQQQPPQSTKNSTNHDHQTSNQALNIDFAKIQAPPNIAAKQSKVPNNRYQDDNISDDLIPTIRSVFDMKRRSCGPSEQGHHLDDDISLLLKSERDQMINNNNQQMIQSQRFAAQSQVNGGFGLRKFSQQVQFSNKLINKQEEMMMIKGSHANNHNNNISQKIITQQQQARVNNLGNNPKDEIIKFFSKYIKQTKFNDNKKKEKEANEYEETIQNLKDFLQYLEDKNIINCKRLENDKEEMTNLIQDLMKLDLNKFSNKQPTSATCKNSPITSHQQPIQNSQIFLQKTGQNDQNSYNSRRNSADPSGPHLMNNLHQQQDSKIKSPINHHNLNNDYMQNYKHKLPLNSPNNERQQQSANNIVCYYAPVNVNGNGNIVNAMPQQLQMIPQQQQQYKQFNCSQKLFFNGNQSSIQIGEDYEEDIESLRMIQNQQQQQQQQPIFFKQQSGHHKRVNSNKVPLTPSSALLSQQNQKFNFAFGGAQQNKQQYVVLDSQQNKQQHFHNRKNSLFMPSQKDISNNEMLKQQFYPQQKEEADDQMLEETACEAIPFAASKNNRLTHRRATTNLINPSSIAKSNAQTIQVASIPNGPTAIFCDDIGLVEERDKLIKYIKLYTSKCLEAPQTTLDYYKFMKLIGKGAFGKVTLGIHKLTGKQVAIKTVDKSLMKDEYQRKKVLQEVHLLKKVRHQNVIRLLEVFESSKHLLMVMEYAGGGDLLQYVKKRRRLDEDEARRIFKQIVYGLAHCHCRSVLHRDIKLDNILLDNEGEIKICDFGVSRIIKKNQKITEQCGTPAYIAPEIISDSGYEGFSADVWSLGVLLYAMLCGTVPFKAQNMHDLHQIITSGAFSYPSQVEPLLSEESKDLINKMLVINPKNRISIPEILSHSWMINKECDDLLLQDDMIDITNRTRGGKDLYTMGQSSLQSEDETSGEPDINQVQIDNLFIGSNSYQTKLSYTDYCAITQDFATMQMNEEALQVMEGMGFPRKLVRDGLNKGELNHATATYNLLVLN